MRARRYELFLDDLPVWGFVGPPPEETKDEQHIYIWTHKSFDINYNEDRVRRGACTSRTAHLLRQVPAGKACHCCPGGLAVPQ